MIKNIINHKGVFGLLFSFALSTSLFVFTGCSRFEENDSFDESAALRIVHFNESLKSRLVEQSTNGNNGWVIQYFVAGTGDVDFEGFNLYGRFYNDGKVTLAGNHRFLRNGNANKYTEFNSLYDVVKEEGPVLAFNSWNDVLTVFTDPVDPASAPNNLVKNGEGMCGDQNLVFHGYEGNNILFSGQRYASRVRFVPCDRPWQDYIKDTEATKNYITNSVVTSYYVVCGTDTLYFTNLRSGVITYCERVYDPLFPSIVNCVFTPNGFCLQHRNRIGRTSFQDFSLSPDKTHLVSENDSVQVIPTWDNYIVNARSSVWNFDQDNFSEEQKALLAQIDVEAKKFNKDYSLDKVGLGRSTGSGAVKGLVFTFKVKNKTNTAGLSLTTVRPQFGQMKIAYSDDEKPDRNLTTMANKCNIETLARQFAATLSGTYDMIPDNYFLPTGCELHGVGNDNIYILK